MSADRLIADARARLTARRIGGSIMRETDKDLVVIRRLADALEARTPAAEVPEPSTQEVTAYDYNPRETLLRDLYSLRGWTGGDAASRAEIIDRAMAFVIAQPEPQGTPSDAQDIVVQEVSRLAGLRLLRRYSGFSDHWWDELIGGIARVALRAAGGAR